MGPLKTRVPLFDITPKPTHNLTRTMDTNELPATPAHPESRNMSRQFQSLWCQPSPNIGNAKIRNISTKTGCKTSVEKRSVCQRECTAILLFQLSKEILCLKLPKRKSAFQEKPNRAGPLCKEGLLCTWPSPTLSISMMVTMPGCASLLPPTPASFFVTGDLLPVKLLATVSPNIVRPFVIV